MVIAGLNRNDNTGNKTEPDSFLDWSGTLTKETGALGTPE